MRILRHLDNGEKWVTTIFATVDKVLGTEEFFFRVGLDQASIKSLVIAKITTVPRFGKCYAFLDSLGYEDAKFSSLEWFISFRTKTADGFLKR